MTKALPRKKIDQFNETYAIRSLIYKRKRQMDIYSKVSLKTFICSFYFEDYLPICHVNFNILKQLLDLEFKAINAE